MGLGAVSEARPQNITHSHAYHMNPFSTSTFGRKFPTTTDTSEAVFGGTSTLHVNLGTTSHYHGCCRRHEVIKFPLKFILPELDLSDLAP